MSGTFLFCPLDTNRTDTDTPFRVSVVRCLVRPGGGVSAESPVIALTTGVVQKRRKTITIFPSGEGRIDSLKVAPLATGVGMQRVIPQVFKL